MIAAAAARFGSELIVGGFRYVVKPPTVAVALAVTAALEHGGDATDDYLREAVGGSPAWLPLSLRSVLFSKAVSPHERHRVIAGCLLAGIPDERIAQAQRQQERVQEQARARGWAETLATYRRIYGAADVLAEPWPVFLNQADQMDAEEARQNVMWGMAYAAVRTGGDHWRALHRMAGLGPPPMTDEERKHSNAQAARIEAQIRAKQETGSMLDWESFMEPGAEA